MAQSTLHPRCIFTGHNFSVDSAAFIFSDFTPIPGLRGTFVSVNLTVQDVSLKGELPGHNVCIFKLLATVFTSEFSSWSWNPDEEGKSCRDPGAETSSQYRRPPWGLGGSQGTWKSPHPHPLHNSVSQQSSPALHPGQKRRQLQPCYLDALPPGWIPFFFSLRDAPQREHR